MEAIGLPIVVMFMMCFNFGLCYKIRTDDELLNTYVHTSPKAWMWRKVFGADKAASIIRNRFAPLGMLVATVMFLCMLAILVLNLLARFG